MNDKTSQLKALPRQKGQPHLITRKKFTQIGKKLQTKFYNEQSMQMLGTSFKKIKNTQKETHYNNNTSCIKNQFYMQPPKQLVLVSSNFIPFVRKKSLNKQNIHYDFQNLTGYCGRLTAKQPTRNNDIMNSTSPLEAWRQITQNYAKQKIRTKQIKIMEHQKEDPNSQSISQSNSSAKRLKQFCEKFNQKNQIGNKTYEPEEKNQNKKQNNKEQQLQLQKNIVLKKSLSCKSSGIRIKIKIQTDHRSSSFLTENQSSKLRKIKIESQAQHSKQQQDNPIILLHKQPLQDYMSLFFKPVRPQVYPQNSSATVVRSLIRVKSKKMTTRSIQHLQKIKVNLFKEKTKKDLFQKEASEQNTENKQDDCKEKEIKRLNNVKKLNMYKKSKTQFGIDRQQTAAQMCDSAKIQPLTLQIKDEAQIIGKFPSMKKILRTSSIISFGEESTPVKSLQNSKTQQFFNAW